MIRNTRLLIVGSLGMLILSGCSTKYPVTFDSNPKGAIVVCSGKNYGTIPIHQFPNEVKQTLDRPFGDGYEKDAQFAIKMQNSEYQRR